MLYFAYGSNMAPRQMASRCPGARPVGAARLTGWRFHITARGTANIIPRADARVHGVIWRCEPHHLGRLDHWEGVSWRNYRRRRVHVECSCGARLSAITYVSSRSYRGCARPEYMLHAVLPGARAFDLPPAFVSELESWLPQHPIGGRSRSYVGAWLKRSR